MYKIGQNMNFGFNLLIGFALSGILQVAALSQAQAKLSAGDSLNDSGLPPVDCRKGFVGVPGNGFYDTKDFCVMKYEARRDGAKAVSTPDGTPWVRIHRARAMAACEASGLKLLTNAHWQTIAHNIELVPKNWANGKIGDAGGLNRGHSDKDPFHALMAGDDSEPCANTGNDCTSGWTDQKRTHTLSNRGQDEVIWDFAGNVWEWVSDHNSTDYGRGWTYISKLRGDTKTMFGPSGDYSAGSPSDLTTAPYGNLGLFYPGTDGGVFRGGGWSNSRYAGVFAALLGNGPSDRSPDVGFRCFYFP